MEKGTLEGLPKVINSAKVAITKAVDPSTNEILGSCSWGFRGLDESEIPIPEGAAPKNDTLGDAFWKDKRSEEDVAKSREKQEDEEVEQSEGIQRLNAITGKDMTDWMTKLMPDGTRCMFVNGFGVDVKHQRKGVGKALLKWGTDFADEKGIFIWVHSSQGAVPAYRSAGFEEFSRLNLDLDEFAPAPPAGENDIYGNGKWGSYSLVWMKYLPKVTKI